MILGLDRADQLGDMVGIDVHGKSPTKDDGGMYVYYDHPPINGKPVKKLSFTRSLKKFDVVWIDFE